MRAGEAAMTAKYDGRRGPPAWSSLTRAADARAQQLRGVRGERAEHAAGALRATPVGGLARRPPLRQRLTLWDVAVLVFEGVVEPLVHVLPSFPAMGYG